MDKILITICARGGSKGIPGKNIKEIGGKPLIYYSLKIAQAFKNTNDAIDIFLSTDSAEIKSVVEGLVFENIDTSYTRPEELAGDASGKLDVIYDIKNFAEDKTGKKYDYVLDLDVTSPLRTIEDLNNAFEKLKNREDALNIFSVSPANRNPYFNMVEIDGQGFVKLCKTGNFLTRQSSPNVYDLNASFYFYKSRFFENGDKFKMIDKSLIYEVPHICFDLDEEIDFDFMSYLLENDKLSFEFLR